MRLIAFFGLVLFASHAFSAHLKMACHDQKYLCLDKPDGSKHCTWATGIGTEEDIELAQNKAYADQKVWVGITSFRVQDAFVSAEFQVIEKPEGPEYSSTISLSQGNLFAESSGSNFVRAGLRDQEKGVGGLCHSLKFLP